MRRRRPEKRTINPDPKFNDLQISKFMNYLLTDGKKGIAEKILYDAFDIVKDKSKKDPVDIFKKALNNVMPSVEVKSRRIGGANFQVPIEARPARKITLSQKWLIQYARSRNEKTMVDRLANEIIAASKGEGGAVKKKDDTHRMAEANKAFSHFRF